MGALFTPDAVFGSPGRLASGRAEIVANYRRLGELYPISLHEARGLVLEFVDDGQARGQVIGYSEQASVEHTVATSFRYDDEYARVDGQWHFAARRNPHALRDDPRQLASGGLARPLRKRWPHRPPGPAELPVHLVDEA